jgi:hypothetical protein
MGDKYTKQFLLITQKEGTIWEENVKLNKQLLLCTLHSFGHTHSYCLVASTFQHSNEPSRFVVTGGTCTIRFLVSTLLRTVRNDKVGKSDVC